MSVQLEAASPAIFFAVPPMPVRRMSFGPDPSPFLIRLSMHPRGARREVRRFKPLRAQQMKRGLVGYDPAGALALDVRAHLIAWDAATAGGGVAIESLIGPLDHDADLLNALPIEGLPQ